MFSINVYVSQMYNIAIAFPLLEGKENILPVSMRASLGTACIN